MLEGLSNRIGSAGDGGTEWNMVKLGRLIPNHKATVNGLRLDVYFL